MERSETFRLWLKKTWGNVGPRLVLAISFVLVGILCFEAGLLQKSLSSAEAPVIIRVAEPALLPSGGVGVPKKAVIPEKIEKAVVSETPTSSCQFVGSRNSNKYHHPTSRCAKQIKPENKRCFASVEDAKAKGYLPGCLTP